MRDERKVHFARLIRILKECDLAIEVVDARDPNGTRVPKLDRQFRSKVVAVASKADMIPEGSRIGSELDRVPLIYFSSRTREGLGEVFRLIRKKAREKGLEEIKVGVFGIPNVGKSTFINILRGRHSAPTGFRAGITRGPQWVRIRSGILLLDTAGVVGLKETTGELALKSAFNAERLKDPEKVALSLIGKFLEKGEDSIFSHYGIERADDPESALESIARRRGLLLKGGELNIPETARVVIRDFQKGKFLL